MWTYKQVYDKLTEAYISGKVDPWDPCFCMVGNMLNNTQQWASCRGVHSGLALGRGLLVTPGTGVYVNEVWNKILDRAVISIKEESENTYNAQEIADIEIAFLSVYQNSGGRPTGEGIFTSEEQRVINEEALWKAFVAGLEYIKSIHIARGENVEQEVALVKRVKEAVV
jgi:hypothetical protein